MSIRPSPIYDILKIVKDFAERGVGRRFVADTLNITYGSATYWLERLVTERVVRKEYKFVWRKPYYYWWSYYPVPVVPLPPPPLPPVIGYVHKTLVYNISTGTVGGTTIEISTTFDYDSLDEEEIKERLQRIAFMIANAWVLAKFANIPRETEWSETKERPTEVEVAGKLKEAGEGYTKLHYYWTWKRGDGVSENAEGDMNWDEEMRLMGSLGEGRSSYFGVKKGRKEKVE